MLHAYTPDLENTPDDDEDEYSFDDETDNSSLSSQSSVSVSSYHPQNLLNFAILDDGANYVSGEQRDTKMLKNLNLKIYVPFDLTTHPKQQKQFVLNLYLRLQTKTLDKCRNNCSKLVSD